MIQLEQNKIDALRAQKIAAGRNFIDGEMVAATSGKEMNVSSPVDGKILGTIPDSEAEDVNRAVFAARKSFEAGHWSKLAPAMRKKVLLKWADLIEKNALEIAVLGARDNGTDIRMALMGEPTSAAATIRFYAEAVDKVNGEITPTRSDVLSLIQKEPWGLSG